MKRNKLKDWICKLIANLLPKRVLYWVIIRVWAKSTTTTYSNKHPDEVTWAMAIQDL